MPDSPAITAGRVYAELRADGRVNTGIVISNPNSSNATIHFEIRNEQGSLLKTGSFTLSGACNPGVACNSQDARGLDQEPYATGGAIQGTLTLTSTVPVTMFAMRWLASGGASGDFLMTAVPFIDLSVSPSGIAQVLPLFVAGDGRKSEVVMVNPTAAPMAGILQFLDAGGAPAFLAIGGGYEWNVEYSIAPNGSQKLVVAEAPSGFTYGSVRVVPYANSAAPVSVVIHNYERGGITDFDIALPATMGTAFRLYMEQSPFHQIYTGIVVANATNYGGTVWISVRAADDSVIAYTSRFLPPAGQIAETIDTLLPALANQAIEGVIRITTDLPSISVAGLRMRINERQQTLYAAFAPVLENAPSTSEERFFPYVINGGGFTTRVALFSGHSGEHSAGHLRFVQADGTPLDLGLYPWEAR